MTSTSSKPGLLSAAAVRGTELGGEPLRVLAVGLDDPLHQLVADDVLPAEAHELDALDRLEDLADHDESRTLVVRQVDLGDVAGYHHLRVEPQPGEEHLHLP